jgi:hypothetical protein
VLADTEATISTTNQVLVATSRHSTRRTRCWTKRSSSSTRPGTLRPSPTRASRVSNAVSGSFPTSRGKEATRAQQGLDDIECRLDGGQRRLAKRLDEAASKVRGKLDDIERRLDSLEQQDHDAADLAAR